MATTCHFCTEKFNNLAEKSYCYKKLSIYIGSLYMYNSSLNLKIHEHMYTYMKYCMIHIITFLIRF